MRILGLDIGSSSVKAGVWDESRHRAISGVRVAYATRFEGPRAEIDATQLLRAVRKAATGARGDLSAGRVDALAFCAFSSGVVITDREGTPRTPIITHGDRRSAAVAQALVDARGQRWWLSRTGNLPYPGGIGASTLAWLRAHRAGVYRGRYRAGQVSCLVGHMLTGRWAIDPSQATFLGLWDCRRQVWNQEVCRAVGVDPGALPQLQWVDEPLGGLLPGVARVCGLAGGTPVVGGLVDTSAAVLQTPMAAGQLVHNTGSTDVLAMCLDAPRPAEGILTRPVGVGRVFPQKWLAVRTIAASGSALQWVRNTLFGELSDRVWRDLTARACTAGGLDEGGVVCVPAFAGERAAIAQEAGAEIRGLHLGTTREQILSAVVGALVARSAGDFAILRRLHRPRPRVYAMGGAGALAEAMHRAWPGRRHFVPLSGDALPGLAYLASRTLSAGR